MQPDLQIAFINVLDRIGLIGAVRRLTGRRTGMVLAFNRVLPRNERNLCFDPGIAIDEAAFLSLLRLLQQNYEVVPLDDLLANPRGAGHRAKVALTFDDGWEDTFRIAFPHLLAHRTPATVFLCTGLIGTRQTLPEERFARLWAQCAAGSALDALISDLSYWGLGRRRSRSLRPQRRYWSEEIKRMPLMGRLPLLDHLEERYRIAAIRSRRFLTWDEIRAMMRTGLVRVGSHTTRHAILPIESDREIRRELEDSRNVLWERTGTVPEILSYPDGMYNRRVLELVRSLGIRVALSDDPGLVTPRTNRWRVPRVAVRARSMGRSAQGTEFFSNRASAYFLDRWLRSPIAACAERL